MEDQAPGSSQVPEPRVRPLWWRALRGFVVWFSHLLDDRAPSQYSSIAPRREDGSRTKPFNFHGDASGH